MNSIRPRAALPAAVATLLALAPTTSFADSVPTLLGGQPWKLGISFEEATYLREGVDVTTPFPGGRWGEVGASIGSQTFPETISERRHRQAVDYRLVWTTTRPIAPDFGMHSSLEIGEQTYPYATRAGGGQFGYLDALYGFVFTSAYLDAFVDVGLRVNFIDDDHRDYVFGDRKVEPAFVYPRFGFAYRFE